MTEKCKFCGATLTDLMLKRGDGFCSNKCKGRFISFGYKHPKAEVLLNRKNIGAIGEYSVILDLLNKGAEVFHAVSPSSSCDLIALKEGNLYRVEVTVGYRYNAGKLHFDLHDKAKYDIIAVVTQGEIVYLPGLPA